jgi:flagellar hook-associated protein 2
MEIAGLDADLIVSQLMQVERRPLVALETRKSDARAAADAIGRIRSKIDAFRLAADRLTASSSFRRFSAAVSNTDAVAVTVGGATAATSLSFTVDQLAQAHGLRSIGTVSSTGAAIVSEALLAVSSGTSGTGLGGLRVGAGLGAGSFDITVTQASAAAASTGTSGLAATTVIDGTNNALTLTVNGAARSITIASGTYDAAGLATAVQDALTAGGGGATATLDSSGALQIATSREGSTAGLQITGGSALADLRLGVDATARTGVDGVVEINGTSTAVTSAEAGTTLSFATGSGNIDATLSGGLRVGTNKVAVVGTGDRSLADVTAAINQAGVGVSAAAVQVSPGSWRLQLTAGATGEAAGIGIDGSVFTGIGGMIESSAARNAQITIGSGPGAYQVEASGNTFRDVLPGVTVTAKQVSTDPINVTLARDNEAIADDVTKLVTSINELLADIKVQTRADPASGTKGPLAGNATIRQLSDQLRNALAGQVSGLGMSLPSSVGIERDRTGTFTFDRQKFLSAIADDPEGVTRLFSRGGTETGDAVFAVANANTVAGSYAVEITTAASRASSALLFDGGAAANSRLGVRIGAITATLDVQAGQTTTEIVQNLNAALAEAGLDVVAQTDGTGVRLVAGEWGQAGNFELNTDVLGAGSWSTLAGTDVAGTIDGVLATGTGRRLVLATDASSPAAGLGVDVAGGLTGAIGSVDYVPGLAARVVAVTTLLTRAETGLVSSAKTSAEGRVTAFDDQIARLEDRLFTRETNMRRQWANLQTMLSGLQNQGSWLSGQLSSLNNNWGSI